MERLFKKYNARYFNGSVKYVPIFVHEEVIDGNFYGYYDGEEIHLIIEDYKSTLLHEMFHVWQEDFDPTFDWDNEETYHGKTFKEFAKFVYLKDGIEI